MLYCDVEYRFVGPGYRCPSVWLLRTILLVCLCMLPTSSDYPPDYPDSNHRRVAFACQNSWVILNCSAEGERIRILRANYGRFSLYVCNRQGVTDGWNLQCMSRRSLQEVAQRCDSYPNCTFKASNDVFGDPCPGTSKYIEVHYFCERVRTTPPSTLSTSSVRPTTPSRSSPSTSHTTPSRTSTSTTQQPVVTTTRQQRERMCRHQVVGGTGWPGTEAGEIVEMSCPGNTIGIAYWRCGQNGRWIGQPDFSECESRVVANIEEMMENEDIDTETVADALVEAVANQTLQPGDLIKTVDQLMPRLVRRMRKQIDMVHTPSKKHKKAAEFSRKMVSTGSKLLSKKQRDSWAQLGLVKRNKVATSLIVSMEETAFQIATVVESTGTVTASDENILMEVNVLESEGSGERSIELPSAGYGVHHGAWRNMEDRLVLPLDDFSTGSRHGNMTVTFLAYHSLNELMSCSSKDEESSNNSLQEDERWIINTNIISATINGRQGRMSLSRPMTYTLRHKQVSLGYNPACSFWSYNPSDYSGFWSQEGCSLVSTNDGQTQCQCDHLTNFAVLMDVTGTKLSRAHELSLTAVTYVGCTVSIICLFISFISFVVFRNLQSDRNTVHKNLVLCLMIAELIFLFGIAQTDDKVVCSVIAGFLHYFFLASFGWMCLEGIQLYFMLIEVFEAERSRVKWFYLFGYGLPAVIVAIAAGIDHTGYGTDTHCWLRTDNYFILSFVLPVGIVIILNLIMLGIAVYMMCRHANVTAMASKAKDKGKLERMGDHRPVSQNSVVSETASKTFVELPTWLKGAAVLVVLLGLTWTFGLLYVNEDSVAFAYIFTILNSLQGLFIFIFHCLMDRKVKKEYRKGIQRAWWLPDVVRVNCGGYNRNLSSPNPSSSTGNHQYFFMRFWSSKRRKKSNSSISKSSPKNHRSDLDSFLSSQTSSNGPPTTGTGVHRYSNQSDKLLSNGSPNCYTKMTPCYEDGIVGDLSVIDCSMVDSEFVTEYCNQNLQITQEERRYSSCTEDDQDIQSVDKDRLSLLSEDSAIKNQSDFMSTDNEDGRSEDDVHVHAYENRSLHSEKDEKLDTVSPDKTESEQNLLNNLLTLQSLKCNQTDKSAYPSLDGLCNEPKSPIKRDTENNRSTPNIKFPATVLVGDTNPMDTSSAPLLGSLPDLSAINEEELGHDNQPFSLSVDGGPIPQGSRQRSNLP